MNRRSFKIILILAAILILPVASYGAVRVANTLTAPNLDSGLVGHWTFDGKDLIQNVKDSSGQGDAGYLSNFTSTTTVPGKIGQALQFQNSLQQSVKIATTSAVLPLYSANTAYSISMWVKPASFFNGEVLWADTNDTSNKGFNLKLVSKKLNIFIQNDANSLIGNVT